MSNFRSHKIITAPTKFILVILVLYFITGCRLAGMKEDVVDYQSRKAVTYAENGDYTGAYSAVHILYSKNTPRAQERALELMKNHPRIANGAIQYHSSQFKGSASQYETIEQFRSAMQPEIDSYTKLTSPSNPSVINTSLEKEFNESRKLYPARYPENKIVPGHTYDQFINYIPKLPVATVELVAPDDPNLRVNVYEYKFIPPKSSGLNESISHWFAFMDNKLAFSGVGSVKEAEYQLFQQWVSYKLSENEMSRSTAYKAIYAKYQELYGAPDELTNEQITYLIMVTDQLDRKEINETEYEYLLAQKRSEIASKYQILQAQRDEKQRQEDLLGLQKKQLKSQQAAQDKALALARSQLLLQGRLGLMQLQQNERMIIVLTNLARTRLPPTDRDG